MTTKTSILAAALAFGLVACGHGEVAQKPAPPAVTAVAAPPPAPPPLSLVPADVARIGVVATFVVPALDRSLGSGVALVKQAAPLPLDPAGVRDMLLAQAGLPAELAKHLDLSAPVAGAAVAAGPGRSPLTAFSFACRTIADVAPLLSALGRTVSRRGAAVQIENATGDRGWFLPQGSVVVLADTDEALTRAGSLALEARRDAKDDVSVTLYPEMIARVVGTDVKTALARMMAEVEERAAATGNKLGPEGTHQLRELADYLADASTAELVLSLDPARGATFMMRLHAKAGSKLEATARQTKTAVVDPAFLRVAPAGKDEVGFALASAYGGATLDQIRRQRAKLPPAGGKASDAAGLFLDALAEGLTGEVSMVGRSQPALSAEMLYGVRDAAGAARIEKALASASKDSVAALVAAVTQGEKLGIKAQNVRQERVAGVKALRAILAVSIPGDTKAAMRKLIGPGGVDVFMAVVSGGRFALVMGAGAKARLAAIVSGQAPAPKKKAAPAGPPPTLGQAIALASDRSLFYFFDLRQGVSTALAVAADPRFRALQGAMPTAMPIVGGMTGSATGTPLTLDLTIPPSCFAGMG
ncbi:MAG: hypothetical protein ABUL77_02220, partial [Bacteroidota bacterium]